MSTSESETTLTINETIAANLGSARRLRNYTQKEAVDRLNQHLDEDWSASTLSLAESGRGGKRVRHFTVEQVVAFAQTFDVSFSYFLLPIEHTANALEPTLLSPLAPKDLVRLLDISGSPATMDRLVRIGRWAVQRGHTSWQRFAERLMRRSPRPSGRRPDHVDQATAYISPAAIRQMEKQIEKIVRKNLAEMKRAEAEKGHSWVVFSDDDPDDMDMDVDMEALEYSYEPRD